MGNGYQVLFLRWVPAHSEDRGGIWRPVTRAEHWSVLHMTCRYSYLCTLVLPAVLGTPHGMVR